MNIVLLCGGKGKRLASISKGKPKFLMPIGQKPFAFILLDSLVNHGVTHFYILIAYGGDQIKTLIGDSYKNIPVKYIQDDLYMPSGTSSAIVNALNDLPDQFLIQYGDTFLDIDYQEFNHISINNKHNLLMSVYSNPKKLDKNNVVIKDNILIYNDTESKHNSGNSNFIDYGLLGVYKSFFETHIKLLKEKPSFKYFQSKISHKKLIIPYFANKDFLEIGTPQSYLSVVKSFQSRSIH